MASGIDRLVKELTRLTKEKKSSAYDTAATVTRVEGNTAWVHIPGGVDETPVRMTINARAGDSVQVRVSGGRAFLVGNGTSPPTDDTRAIFLNNATNVVLNGVAKVANSAQKIAGNTAQYFWTTETGTDTGAHITEKPKEDFLADPNNGGANLLLRSIGIAIRYGLAELASFSANAIQIGSNANTKITLDTTNGLKLGNKIHLDTSGNASFSGTISASSGEFTEGFRVDSPLAGSQTAQFSIDADSQGNEIAMSVVDGSNQAFLELTKNGVAEIYGTLRANLFAAAGGEAVIHAGSRDVAKGSSDGRFACEDWKRDEFRTPVTSSNTDGKRIAALIANSATQLQILGQWGSTGTTYSTGNVAVSSSDIRLKKNVEDCEIEALPVINRIWMRQFDWLNDGEHQKIGFIADELERIDPKLTIGGGYNRDGSLNVKSVDTFYLLGYLTKAVQELSAEVEDLKKKLEECK